MSIYPVKMIEWYPKGDKDHNFMKWIIYNGISDEGRGCKHCKKIHMHYQEAIAHHSLLFGYGDIWCREKCYNNWKKGIKRGKKTNFR
jgi:hypothetical protein